MREAHIPGLTLGLFGAVVKGVSVRHTPIVVLCAGRGAARLASMVFPNDGLSGPTLARLSGVLTHSKLGVVKLLMMAVLAIVECWLCLRPGAILG